MSNIILLFDDSGADATLSGGGFEPALPLTNLLDEDLTKVARTTGVTLAETKFNIALDAAYYSRAVVVGPTNFSPTFQYRIRTWDDAAFSVPGDVDTGWVYPAEDQGAATIHWGDPGYWLRDGQGRVHLIHVFDDVVPAQYWTVEIDDEDNPAGYLDMGRLFMPMGWQPTINYAYEGNGLGFRNNSQSVTTLAGSKRFRRRVNPRQFQFSLPYLPEDEGYTQAYRFMEYVGFDRPVFVIADPDDALHMAKRSFFGTVTQMDPLTQAMFGRAGTAFELEEII